MNPKQIADLWRWEGLDTETPHSVNKVGRWFELDEEYRYDTELGCLAVFPKGVKLKFLGMTLTSYHFKADRGVNFSVVGLIDSAKLNIGSAFGIGQSRLLKMKLREMET